jgi:hypothetical protein
MNKSKVIGLTVTALAVVGGIAVFNYFRKPKPNRDGFFNASGNTSITKGVKNIHLTQTPSNFIRKGGFLSGCALYQKTITPNGFIYSKRRFTKPNSIGFDTFPISETEFINALNSNAYC